MTLLICEGACNPSLPAFDEAADLYAEARQGGLDGVGDDLMAYLEAERRKLQHTPHEQLAGARWACTVCGCERKYGDDRSIGWQFDGSAA